MAALGEILIREKLITTEDLSAALEEQKKTPKPLGKILVERGVISEANLLKTLAKQMHMAFYSKLMDKDIPESVIGKVSIRLISLYNFIPIGFTDNILTIAVYDPFDVWLVQGVKNELHCELRRVLAPEKEIKEAIKKYYGIGASTVDKILDGKTGERKKETGQNAIEDIGKSSQDVSVIKLVNQIIKEAITARATDIHFEPYRGVVKIRQRIDGILYDMKVPDEIRYLYPAIVSRVKIISGLDVIERRLPQDGRAKVKISEEETELRISVLPSSFGESIVIRILPSRLLIDLPMLGFLSEDLKIMREIIKKPHGVIFLTGPTGSGKTTTLYASLSEINSEKLKIITIEDPVEYELVGVSQIQIEPKIGLTFAAALRSILRHDPDIMMVGEVRDAETAELTVRSSLTGHLVFSTLHTNDAASGVTRLLNMGVEPFLVASSVEVFISQRLVRLLCPKCKKAIEVPQAYKGYNLGEVIYEPGGCDFCENTGFRGRTVIYEMLIVNDEIRKLILNKVTAEQIRKKACEQGMKPLKESGVEKIRQGITTLGEIMRVVELKEY